MSKPLIVQELLNYKASMLGASAAYAPFLERVERELVAQLTGSEFDTMGEAARYLCLGSSAKRARPLLARIFGEALNVDESDLIPIAVAAELIHGSSLLHDDVVDSGMFRRGRPTVNSRWGNAVAVLAGDVLLSNALLRLSLVHGEVVQRALATVAEMSRAAYAEVQSRGRLDVTLEELKRIAEGKTGSLFGFCGTAAAIIGGDTEAGRHFDNCGRQLGVAFQMADDIRDVLGTDPGKPRFADLASRTMSLPIVLAVGIEPSLRRRISETWSWSALTAEKTGALGALVIATGAVDRAIALVNDQIARAREALGPYAQSPAGLKLVAWAQSLAEGFTRVEPVALQSAAVAQDGNTQRSRRLGA